MQEKIILSIKTQVNTKLLNKQYTPNRLYDVVITVAISTKRLWRTSKKLALFFNLIIYLHMFRQQSWKTLCENDTKQLYRYNSGAISHGNKFWCCLPEKGWGSWKFFLMQLFAILFSYTIFKQFFNILATQNQNCNQNWPFLTKDMNF